MEMRFLGLKKKKTQSKALIDQCLSFLPRSQTGVYWGLRPVLLWEKTGEQRTKKVRRADTPGK